MRGAVATWNTVIRPHKGSRILDLMHGLSEAKKSGCGGFEAQREASGDNASALSGWDKDARMSPHQRGQDYLAAFDI